MPRAVKVHARTASIQALVDEARQLIAERAYQLAAERGYGAGRELDDWLTAEKELFWKPPLRLEERRRALIARFLVPALRADEITLAVDAHHVILMGEARAAEPGEGVHVHVDEFRYGPVYRHVDLPTTIRPEGARAQLQNGVLTVSLPKPGPMVEEAPASASVRRKKRTTSRVSNRGR